MEVKATAKYVRISPLKVNYICREIRGKQVDEALNILRFTNKKGARLLSDVLKSAMLQMLKTTTKWTQINYTYHI